MNHDEIKQILLRYRPGRAEGEDPEVAAALARAQADPDLTRWLEEHCARQAALRAQFRRIRPPAGLKEQIISEQSARETLVFWHPAFAPLAVAAALAGVLGILACFLIPNRASQDALTLFKRQMVGIALRGYGMDLATNNPAQVRDFLARHQAPADYALPPGLQQAALTGCAVESWNNGKVSMLCFRTGKTPSPGAPSDLWLFVVDRAGLSDASPGAMPRFSKINRLLTATWTKGDKLYLLGSESDEQTLRRFL